MTATKKAPGSIALKSRVKHTRRNGTLIKGVVAKKTSGQSGSWLLIKWDDKGIERQLKCRPSEVKVY